MLRRRLIQAFSVVGIIPYLPSKTAAHQSSAYITFNRHSEIGRSAYLSLGPTQVTQQITPYLASKGLDFNTIDALIIEQEQQGQLINVNGWLLTEIETAVIAFQYANERGLI